MGTAKSLEPIIIESECKIEIKKILLKKLRKELLQAENSTEIDKIKKKLVDESKEPIELPNKPRLCAQDITPEATAILMQKNHDRIAILSAEGGVFDLLGGRYSGGVANLDTYLQSHSGDAIYIDRGGRSPINMENPVMTLGLSPQPSVLVGLAKNQGFQGRGLIDRPIYFLPESNLGYRPLRPVPVPSSITDSYHSVILDLLDKKDKYVDGLREFETISLSADAWRRWKSFAHEVEKKLRGGGGLSMLKVGVGNCQGKSLG